jgi:hypothetical protein
MSRPIKFVFLFALAASGLLFGRVGRALPEGAAEGVPPIPVFSHAPVHSTDRPAASALMGEVVTNELSDRVKLQKWLCTIDKRVGNQTLTEVQVETKDGPLYRLMAINGAALNPGQHQQDEERIARLMKDPRPLLKLKQAEDEDELKLQKIISLMPQAFVFEYDGIEEDLIRIKFRPNPDYTPPTYEARIIHSLAGTIFIDPEQKRLAKVSGQLVGRVDFGYGLLGRVDSGTVEFGRVAVGHQQWKTAMISVHFSGRIVFFKTLNKDQYERRSDFHAVSSDLSLPAAKAILDSRVNAIPQTTAASK